jgi:threonine dehydrogenase-like Zn-dependent dehydrogenase
MRAAVMRDRRLLVDDIPEPKPGPGQVLVKTLACGICGSDLHMLKFADRMLEMARRSGQPQRMDLGRDVVMGHEFCAEVLDYGPDTQRRLRSGTVVTSLPVALGPDGIEGIGYSNTLPGGYGERMVLSEMLLLEVPGGLPAEHAALTEPMAVGVHAVAKARPEPGDLPLVIGCGPVGLSVICALKLRGLGPVIAADFSAKRRELASKLGADIVIDPAEQSPYRKWQDLATPEAAAPGPFGIYGAPQMKPGIVFECVGVPGVLQQIFAGSYRGARVVVVGACMEEDRLEPMLGISRELNVQFALGYTPEEFATTLGNLADGKLPGDRMITGKIPVEGTPAAFEELGRADRHAKILVEPWR